MRALWLSLSLSLATVAVVSLSSHDAVAQGVPEVTLRADTDEVEVGDPVAITLTVMGDGARVDAPQLSPLPGVE